MYWLFMICAAVGGTVFVLQFVLAIIGAGADDLDFAHDVPHDMPHDCRMMCRTISRGHGWRRGACGRAWPRSRLDLAVRRDFVSHGRSGFDVFRTCRAGVAVRRR